MIPQEQGSILARELGDVLPRKRSSEARSLLHTRTHVPTEGFGVLRSGSTTTTTNTLEAKNDIHNVFDGISREVARKRYAG